MWKIVWRKVILMTCTKKKGENDHLFRRIAKMEVSTSLCARGKVVYEGYVKSAWHAHGGTLWWKNNKGIVGENFLY